MNVLTLFSGIGAYERALRNIGIDINIIGYCEILDFKSRAYSILHNVPEDLNLGDITKVDPKAIGDFDLLCYSPPCQSWSQAGKRKGLSDPRGTLFYDALKIIQEKKPKYCVMENVANLPLHFNAEFTDMCSSLEKAGYNNYWEIINARDFIPQNRERVYVVSILKEFDDGTFTFPIGRDKRAWWDVIDLDDMRKLTNYQSGAIWYARGLKGGVPIDIQGTVQFNNAIITVRSSGLRFQNNREHPTIMAHYGKGGGNFTIIALGGKVLGGITPRNCFKLMGFEFIDSELLTQKGFSINNQYVMAGDSICVPVLEGIFKNLFKVKS